MPPTPIQGAAEPAGQGLAVTAEALYLANLLLLPGIAFLVLWLLHHRHADSAPSLGANHLRQTFLASLWAGILLIVANTVIIALGGYRAPAVWVVVVIYFTCVHSMLVLLGVQGLARAMAGKHFRFPLPGMPAVPGARA